MHPPLVAGAATLIDCQRESSRQRGTDREEVFLKEHASPRIAYEWRGRFENAEVNVLHAEAFAHPVLEDDWKGQVQRHSLGWVCARDGDELVGFVNVPSDGGAHAFIVDTIVAAKAGRRGIGTQLLAIATAEARAAGCEWLHVDFEDDLRPFYYGACGFQPTNGGLIALKA